VIEDERDMADVRRRDSLNNPQSQIPVLGSFVAWPESSHLTNELGAIDSQVSNEILSIKQIRIPVRLEIWIKSLPLRVDLILIAVDDIGFRMGIQLDGDHVESVFGQLIIVVEEGNELPLGQLQGSVTALGDVAASISEHNPDSRVLLLILLEDPPHMGSLRSVIGNAQLPVRIQLISDRLDRPSKPGLGSIVGGHDYRNQRLI